MDVWSRLGGRKAAMALFGTIVPFSVATVAMFTGTMSADDWIGFTQLHLPLVSGLYYSANVTQKIKADRHDS